MLSFTHILIFYCLLLAYNKFIHVFEWFLVFYFNFNCFTFIPVVAFVITMTFIKVARNKCLNGASIIAVRIVIHPFASKKVECRKNSFSTQCSAYLCGKSGVHDKRHNTIYSDYSQVLNAQQDLLASNSTRQWFLASTKVHDRIHSWVFPTHYLLLTSTKVHNRSYKYLQLNSNHLWAVYYSCITSLIGELSSKFFESQRITHVLLSTWKWAVL